MSLRGRQPEAAKSPNKEGIASLGKAAQRPRNDMIIVFDIKKVPRSYLFIVEEEP
jgi:hypothetical protein